MRAEKFVIAVDEVLTMLKSSENKVAFLANMRHLNIKDKPFSEWIMTYLAWNELGSEEDCKAFYWHLEEE